MLKTFAEVQAECLAELDKARPQMPSVNEAEAIQLVLGAFLRVTGKNWSRFDLLLHSQDFYPESAVHVLIDWTIARARGWPLQYLIGRQTFLEHDYVVGPGVLVPRPETEVLVASLFQFFGDRGFEPGCGVEIGLGSGAISIELLSRWQNLKMISSEASKDAMGWAVQNAENILGGGIGGADRLQIISVESSDQVLEPFADLSEEIDFLVTNPPYLARDLNEVDPEVMTHEPHQALFAPETDLLYFYRRIARDASKILKNTGVVFAELPHERATLIVELFKSEGWSCDLIPDLTQRSRVIRATLV